MSISWGSLRQSTPRKRLIKKTIETVICYGIVFYVILMWLEKT